MHNTTFYVNVLNCNGYVYSKSCSSWNNCLFQANGILTDIWLSSQCLVPILWVTIVSNYAPQSYQDCALPNELAAQHKDVFYQIYCACVERYRYFTTSCSTSCSFSNRHLLTSKSSFKIQASWIELKSVRKALTEIFYTPFRFFKT